MPNEYLTTIDEARMRVERTRARNVAGTSERVVARSTQPGPTGGDREPDGHREGRSATDDDVREAGRDR
jgi:hypothetical protein